MKISVESAVLAKSLQTLGGIVDRRMTIPILGNVLLCAKDGKLALTVNNLDMEASAEIGLIEGGDVSITAPCALLADIAAKASKGSHLQMAIADSRMEVTDGSSEWNLPTLEVKDFPRFKPKEWACNFEIAAQDLEMICRRTVPSISREEARPYLAGTFLHPQDDRLIAVSSDGHRLTKVEVPLPEGAGGLPGILIPSAMMQYAGKLAGTGGGSVAVKASETMIRLDLAGITVTSKLVDGTFPEYDRIIPSMDMPSITMPREALLSAVERVSLIQNGVGTIEFEPSADGIELKAGNRNTGAWASAMVSGQWAGEGKPFSINGRYVRDGMSILPDSDAVLLSLDPSGPGPSVWTAPGADGTLHVIMTLR